MLDRVGNGQTSSGKISKLVGPSGNSSSPPVKMLNPAEADVLASRVVTSVTANFKLRVRGTLSAGFEPCCGETMGAAGKDSPVIRSRME